MIDEADTFLAEAEELRGVLNSGHRRTGEVIRDVGDDFEPRRFSTWAPVAIAAIGKIPGTLEDRSDQDRDEAPRCLARRSSAGASIGLTCLAMLSGAACDGRPITKVIYSKLIPVYPISFTIVPLTIGGHFSPSPTRWVASGPSAPAMLR